MRVPLQNCSNAFPGTSYQDGQGLTGCILSLGLGAKTAARSFGQAWRTACLLVSQGLAPLPKRLLELFPVQMAAARSLETRLMVSSVAVP